MIWVRAWEVVLQTQERRIERLEQKDTAGVCGGGDGKEKEGSEITQV